MSDDVCLILDAAGVVVATAVGAPADIPLDDGQTAVAFDQSAAKAKAWIGSTRLADGSWEVPVVAVVEDSAPPVTVVAKVEFFRRCTDAEADQIQGALAATSSRMQAIFNSAVNFRSDAEEWPLLKSAAVGLFGDARAAVLLASSA